MKYLLHTGLLLLILLGTNTAQAQLIFTSPQQISGLIVDDSTGQAVPYAQVFNESKQAGCISDKAGHFKMRGDIGDTLVFSQVGYFGKVQLVGDLNLDSRMEVRIRPRFYEIAEVRIMRWGSYADFKRSVLALELPETQTDQLRDYLFAVSQAEVKGALKEEEVRKALSPEPGKPLGAMSVPILSREDLQRINYAKVLEKEKEQRIINQKYNRDIIRKVTNIHNDEIIDFMGFCNFSNEYLLQATEYEIVVMIEKKYQEYQDKKSRGELHPGIWQEGIPRV